MRVLVEAIDSHVELGDLEVTSNFNAVLHTTSLPPPDSGAQLTGDVQAQPYSTTQLAEDVSAQIAEDAIPSQPTDPAP